MRQVSDVETAGVGLGGLLNIATGARFTVASAFQIGLGGNLELGTADLIYSSQIEDSAPMATKSMAVDAYGELAVGGSLSVALRGGIHYATFSVETDRTEPMLLGEQSRGAIVGIGGTVPMGTRVLLSAAIDVMPAGERQSSAEPMGLPARTGVQGGWAHATLAIQLPAHLIAALAYRGRLLAAERDGATQRRDQSHAVTAGVGMAW